MGLFDRWLRPAQHSDSLQRVMAGMPAHVDISDVEIRKVFTIAGKITELHSRPDHCFRAVVTDGTGQIDLIWLGRDSIPGLDAGAYVTARGTVGLGDDGALRIIDPQYSIQVVNG